MSAHLTPVNLKHKYKCKHLQQHTAPSQLLTPLAQVESDVIVGVGAGVVVGAIMLHGGIADWHDTSDLEMAP